MEQEKYILLSRLRNCLQTILELESDLQRINLLKGLNVEYNLLKKMVNNLEVSDLREFDVAVVERATNLFLKGCKR